MRTNLFFLFVFCFSMIGFTQGSEYFVMRYTGATDKSLIPLIVTKNQVPDKEILPVFSDFKQKSEYREQNKQVFIDLAKKRDSYIAMSDSAYVKFINLATNYYPQEAIDTTFPSINISLYHYKNDTLNIVRLVNREECRLYLTKFYEKCILESFSEKLKKCIREYLHYINPVYFDN